MNAIIIDLAVRRREKLAHEIGAAWADFQWRACLAWVAFFLGESK